MTMTVNMPRRTISPALLALVVGLTGYSVVTHAQVPSQNANPSADVRRIDNATSGDSADGAGWFWYRDRLIVPRVEPKPEAAVPPTKVPDRKPDRIVVKTPDPVKPAPLSVAWLQENLEKYRIKAIDEPTTENVAVFALLNKVYLDKADRFERAVMKAVRTDPLLDENNRFPRATAMRAFAISNSSEARSGVIKELAKIGGLFYFYDAKCQWCLMQTPVIEQAAKRHGLVLRYISMDGSTIAGVPNFLVNEGQAQSWGIKVTPAIVYAIPPNKGMILSQGLVSLDSLEERLILAAESENMISESMLAKIDPTAKGVLTTDDMNNPVLREIGDDPAKMVAYLRQKLDLRLTGTSDDSLPPVRMPSNMNLLQPLSPSTTQAAATILASQQSAAQSNITTPRGSNAQSPR